MAILNVSDAAKAAKVSRSYIYKLRNEGKLSMVDNNGKTGVDTSELLRVFGELHINPVDEVVGSSSTGVFECKQECLLLQTKIEGLEALISAKDAHIRALETHCQHLQTRLNTYDTKLLTGKNDLLARFLNWLRPKNEE